MNDYVNCYEGNSWDSSYCPDPVSCAQNCGLDGIPPEDWSGTYGITQQSDKGNLEYVRHVISRNFCVNVPKNFAFISFLKMSH